MRGDWIYPYSAASAAEPQNLSSTVQQMRWQGSDKRGRQLRWLYSVRSGWSNAFGAFIRFISF